MLLTSSKIGIIIIIILAILLLIVGMGSTNDAPSEDRINAVEDIDEAALSYLDVCMNTVSISDIENCKIELNKLNEMCATDELFNSMIFCNDIRVIEFYENADARIQDSEIKIENAKRNLELANLNLVKNCLRIAPITPLSPQFNSFDLEHCDITMNIKIPETCEEFPSFEFCSDGTIDEYHRLRAQ